jgi:soluble lytic murein transglycosylase-like protein
MRFHFYREVFMRRVEKERSPVILRTSYDRLRKKWMVRFFLTNVFYLILVGILGLWVTQSGKTSGLLFLQQNHLNEYKMKENIYSILRSQGVSLSQGMDIAEVTIRQSKALNLPISLILAVMKKESIFTPYALSSQNAMGLMQVHSITWEEYVVKLNLKVSTHAAFDPATNIIVATHVIKDLFDFYKETGKSETDLWNSVFSAYYAGKTSLSQTGITDSHSKYIADINRFKGEYDEIFSN